MCAASTTKAPSGVNLSNAEKIKRRAELIEQIRAMLAEKPMTLYDIANRLGLSHASVYNYAIVLEESGQVKRAGRTNGARGQLWELGARGAENGMDTPERQSESLQVLEQALARPARGTIA